MTCSIKKLLPQNLGIYNRNGESILILYFYIEIAEITLLLSSCFSYI